MENLKFKENMVLLQGDKYEVELTNFVAFQLLSNGYKYDHVCSITDYVSSDSTVR